jgi:DNA-binding transcriptional regulator GbsR (MarR family)
MRPLKHPKNHLLRPLNDILGTQANVRLVRALTLSPIPLTSGELAKRAQLGRTSIYPALRELERAGVIEFVGAGAQRQVQLRVRHPLAGILTRLFRAEAGRFEELIAALRELLEELPFRPISVWADERAQDAQSEHSLRLYFVARPEELEKLTDHFNSSLSRVEHAYDTHIDVKGLTRSEFVTLYGTQESMLSEAVLIGGVPPTALLEPSRVPATKSSVTSHNEHDARARRLALAIATKIKRDPGLISLAEDRMKRRASKASPGERRELTEWMRALSTMSPARLRSFLLEDSERAIRLRQSLPALNLLSPSERNAVIQSQSDADVIAAVTRR